MSNLHNIPIRVANILIELTSPLSAGELGIERWRLWSYRAAGEPEKLLARVALRWEKSESAPAPRGDLIYDPGSIWKMYRAGQNCYALLTYQSEGCVARAHKEIRIHSLFNGNSSKFCTPQ